jgi:hypothetical protein
METSWLLREKSEGGHQVITACNREILSFWITPSSSAAIAVIARTPSVSVQCHHDSKRYTRLVSKRSTPAKLSYALVPQANMCTMQSATPSAAGV